MKKRVRMLSNKWLQAMSLMLILAVPGVAQADEKSLAVPVDYIVAIVNEDVITHSELANKLTIITGQLKKQGTQLPEPATLEKQVLERMITDQLQQQFAKDSGVRIDDAQLDKAMLRIAQQNKFQSVDEFRARLEKDGVDFRKFREEIRNEILTVRLREREVDSKLVISENEIDNYLVNQSKQAGKGEEVELAHILVVVPEQASADKIQIYQKRAQEALAKLKAGAPFSQVAAGYSDAQDALKGGELGWRPAERLPPMFAEALQKMKAGEVSELLRSPSGFHLIKLLDRRSKNTAVVITQTHARHILIKTSELVSENEAKTQLQQVKASIDKGMDFAAAAKQYSEDGSAAQGGELGWLSPGETVPEFEKGMDGLKVGEISGLVQSGFGWHLIQVLERRNTDVSVEQKRQQAREAIRSFRSEDAYQDWMRQLRDRAFIEYRSLEK
jgi:peptidyl-prolyl cis-trans isomerase SurA